MAITIYSLSCPITNTIKYIGKTTNINNRYKSHIKTAYKDSNKNSKWIKELLKNGMKPNIDVVDIVDYSSWNYWEAYYIDLFRMYGFDLNNQKRGDDSGVYDIDLIIAHSKKVTGIKKTDEFIKLMSSIMKGNKHATGNKNKSKEIVCIDILRCSINYYESSSDAARELNVGRTSIGNSLTGLSNIVNKRYIFNYA